MQLKQKLLLRKKSDTETNSRMKNYNYDEFSANEYNLDSSQGPKLGSKAPNFEVLNLGGEITHLLDFAGSFLVLETGSITCPLFQGRRKKMASLVLEFPNVSFSVLYVREAHPGEKIPSHKSIEEKGDWARILRDKDKEQRAILLDDISGTVHSAYGSYPNAVFIINKNGCVVFESDWNSPSATRSALIQLTNGQAASTKSYFLPVSPIVAIKTLYRGGTVAFFDFILSLPKLIWKNLIRRNFLVLMNREQSVRPDTSC